MIFPNILGAIVGALDFLNAADAFPDDDDGDDDDGDGDGDGDGVDDPWWSNQFLYN